MKNFRICLEVNSAIPGAVPSCPSRRQPLLSLSTMQRNVHGTGYKLPASVREPV